MRPLLFFLFSITTIASCTNEETPLERELVVNALVFSGNPVDNIEISRLSPIGQENEIVPSEELVVGFGWRNQGFQLFERPDQEGIYFDPTEEIIVQPGDTIVIQALFEETILESFSIAPSFPEGLEIPLESLELEPEDLESDEPFLVFWSNPDASLYTGIIQLLSDTSNPIIPSSDNEDQIEISLPITDEGAYFIELSEFRFYGDYRMILFHVNPEYANFFLTESGDSQFQINSNISNGFGIFTALSSDTAFFEIIPEQ